MGLTVPEYAAKYGVTKTMLYKALYTKRIKGERTASGWVVDDVPPPLFRSKTGSVAIAAFDDYELTLLWLNAKIIDDDVVIQSKSEFLPRYFSEKFSRATWREEGGATVCKISSKTLVHELREMGFTGRQDNNLIAPDVNTLPFAAAFVESRASFVRQLRYRRQYPMDKAHAYYVPAITMCASYPIMEAVAEALYSLNIIPPRRLYPAANGKSASLKICMWEQLDKLRNTLSVCGRNEAFWEKFDRHIQQRYQPYGVDKRS